jgi:geranylgeranyl pyrophosphate synthase
LPFLLALKSLKHNEAKRLRLIYKKPKITAADIGTATALINRSGARAESYRLAKRHLDRAHKGIDSLALRDKSKEELIIFCQKLVKIADYEID